MVEPVSNARHKPPKSSRSSQRSETASTLGHRPLRIALIMGSFPGPGKSTIVAEAARIAERGHKVTVFADRAERHFRAEHDAAPRGVDVVYFAGGRGFRGLLSLMHILARKLIMRPGQTIRALTILARAEGISTGTFRALRKWLGFVGRSFDVINFEFGHTSFTFLHLAGFKQLVGCKIAQTFRGHDILCWLQSDQERRSELLQNIDGVRLVCKSLLRDARDLGVLQKPYRVVRCPVDSDFHFERTTDDRRTDPECVILTVASLRWVKGFEYSLQALRLLADRGVRFKHVIVGDGPLRQWVEYTIKDLGMSKLVSLLGFQPKEKVIQLLVASDIFLLTSVCEGICVACLEAQAMGLPAVVSDTGGLPEAVCDGVTGFVVPRRNPVATAEKLKLLIEDRELRRKMGQNAVKWIAENFNLEQQTRKMEDFYYEVLAGGDQARCAKEPDRV